MKLLIITQVVNSDDPVLGFFHAWLKEFALRFEKLTVICLEEGKHSLPENVTVLSLGKEYKKSRSRYLRMFYTYIWKERKKYDAVFVHMNPIYVVLGGVIWKSLGKKITLWYTHKSVDLKLRIAEKLVQVIFTASAESFRLKSSKVNVVGHGIDTSLFRPEEQNILTSQDEILKIISIGRISPIKGYETLLGATRSLVREGVPILVSIVGGVGAPNQESYLRSLEEFVKSNNLEKIVTFMGPVSHDKTPDLLRGAHIFVNMSQTGSLDKAILEAMTSGVIIITSNPAFVSVLGKYAPKLIFEPGNEADLALKIKAVMALSLEEKKKMREFLRSVVVSRHSLPPLIDTLVDSIKR